MPSTTAIKPMLAAMLLGVGTAMVYPTLIAAVSDACQPRDRARLVGVYRFWRDIGFAVGAVAAGVVTDAFSADAAITAVALLTAVSGLVVALTRWNGRPPTTEPSAAVRSTPTDDTLAAGGADARAFDSTT